MKNPITRNQRIKRINHFVKYYFYSFVFAFVFSVIAYKTGTMGSGPYKPVPNTWQYVFDHLPEIIVFSLVCGLLLTLPLPTSNDE